VSSVWFKENPGDQASRQQRTHVPVLHLRLGVDANHHGRHARKGRSRRRAVTGAAAGSEGPAAAKTGPAIPVVPPESISPFLRMGRRIRLVWNRAK
jgi:hypothetical protein